MFSFILQAVCYFAVFSPVLLVVGGLCSLISDYRFKKSLK